MPFYGRVMSAHAQMRVSIRADEKRRFFFVSSEHLLWRCL